MYTPEYTMVVGSMMRREASLLPVIRENDAQRGLFSPVIPERMMRIEASLFPVSLGEWPG